MTSLMLTIEADGVDAVRLNQLTGTLHSDLRATGLVTVARPGGTAPERTKSGTGTTIGELVVSGLLSASTMSALARVLTAYIQRTGTRAVVVKRGKDEYRFTGLSADAQRELIDRFAGRDGRDELGQSGR